MNWRVHILPAAVALVIGAGLIMLADRREVVRMEFVSMEPPVLISGSPAIVTWKTNVVRTGCDGEVTRQIIDASNVVFTYSKNRTVINPESVPTQFSGTFTVPVAAAPGHGIHRTIAVRWCNQLQRLFWPLHDPIRDVPITIAAR